MRNTQRHIITPEGRPLAATSAIATALVVAIASAGEAAAQPTPTTTTTTTATAGASSPPAAPIGNSCPSLYVFGVQGPEETSPGADPASDTGMLGQVFGPMRAAVDQALVRRVYIPYRQPQSPASGTSGTATGSVSGARTGPNAGTNVDAAVAATLKDLTDAATGVLSACPDTMLAATGYAEGARVVSRFAAAVKTSPATGGAGIPAAKISGIVLFADPDRAPGTPVLPGRVDLRTPLAPPALAGHDTHTRTITLSDPRLSGGGITAAREPTTTTPGTAGANSSPSSRPTADYGPLAGRVVSFCATGDLTCDAPANGALLQVVHNIAARANLTDPLQAIGAIAAGLASTVFNTTVTVFNNDVTGTRSRDLNYQPQQTISQRLAAASDPGAAQPGVADAITALLRVGMIGLDAATTLAKTVLTPDTIAALITAGVTNPAAAAATLGAKLATAAVQLVPPDAPTRLTKIAFDTIGALVSDNRDLFDLSVLARYSDTIGRRQTYNTSPATPDGTPATQVAANWFAALARDLADAGHQGGQPPRTSTSTPPSVAKPSTSTTSPGPTTPGTSAPRTPAPTAPTPATTAPPSTTPPAATKTTTGERPPSS